MNIESFSTAKYKESAVAAETLQDSEFVPEEARKALRARIDAATVLESIRGIHSDIRIVTDGAPAYAAGFVESGASASGPMYITEQTLEDPTFARHVAIHEKGHLTSGIYGLPILTTFTENHFGSIADALGFDMHTTDLVEGFNEFNTIRQDRRDGRVAYLQKEVPAAEKLEKLCLEVLKISLADLFEKGNKLAFAETLKKLADKLLLRTAYLEQQQRRPNLSPQIRDKVGKRIASELFEVVDAADAEEIVAQIFAEEEKTAVLKEFFATAA
jgi:hypothetical protein